MKKLLHYLIPSNHRVMAIEDNTGIFLGIKIATKDFKKF